MLHTLLKAESSSDFVVDVASAQFHQPADVALAVTLAALM
jgi:hypothetical protein